MCMHLYVLQANILVRLSDQHFMWTERFWNLIKTITYNSNEHFIKTQLRWWWEKKTKLITTEI